MLMRARIRRETREQLRLRLYGLVFLLVLALLVGLAVAVYRKAFVRVVPVTLQATSAGNQLAPPADVKLRGIIVGEVRKVRANGQLATVSLALKPRYVPLIPANVNARMLPKTLFGEKYVDLVIPAAPSPRHIERGDVITQDRSAAAIELDRIFADLLPLLQAVKPAQLNATLSALADALEGRGEALGRNLSLLDDYVGRLNPHLPAIKADIALLADVAANYADAAPDLLATARNLITTSRTVTERAGDLAGFLDDVAGVATTARGVLAQNGDRIIALADVSRPTLALLAQYAPEYPCLLQGLAESEPRLERTFTGHAFHITLEVILPRSGYATGEEPVYGERSGPNCWGLPSPPTPAPALKLNDGARDHNGSILPLSAPAGGLTAKPTSSTAGTAEEQKVIGALLGPVLGRSPEAVPPVATLLFGPLARGTQVSVR